MICPGPIRLCPAQNDQNGVRAHVVKFGSLLVWVFCRRLRSGPLIILDGQPEGIIQFHELLGVGSIGDEKRGDLMAGFTKAPFSGAAYAKRGLVKRIALEAGTV